jgi:zinc transport system ATP-binding protein
MFADHSVVEIDHLNFSYQDFAVLQNVSINVKAGEFVGIIGPNGGGKTTLLKIIMGFLKPTSGKIQLFGASPTNVLSKISYVPQTGRFDKEFPISVLEVVLLGRLSHLPWYGKFCKKDEEIALESLRKVGMLGFEKRSFGTLSGGQAQRVLIARALASNPQLLLLDEPTASVDSRAQSEIYALLEGLKGMMTIMMVTHDLSVAINIVQKVICVQNTVKTLNPQEVCEHFALGLYHAPLINKLESSQREIK